MMTRGERLTRLADLERLLGVSAPPRAYVRYLGGGPRARPEDQEACWGEGGEPPASGPRPEDTVLYVTFVEPRTQEEPRP